MASVNSSLERSVRTSGTNGRSSAIPRNLAPSEISAALARIPPGQRYLAQRNDGAHRVRRRETLAGIAAASGVSLPRLLAANGWTSAHTVERGEVVRIPLPPSRAEAAGAAPEPAPDPVSQSATARRRLARATSSAVSPDQGARQLRSAPRPAR